MSIAAASKPLVRARVWAGSAAILALFALASASRAARVAGESAGDFGKRAKSLYDAKDWSGTAACIEDRLRRAEVDATGEEMLGLALERLGRLDQAAHHLDEASRRFASEGKDDRARAAQAALHRVDPVSPRRESFLRKIASTLYACAEDLSDQGHAERALAILQRLPAVATGKEADKIDALLAKARAAFEEVHLDKSATQKPAEGGWPLFELESQHYKFSCQLEPSVVKRLADVMDDIHASYVQIYFDGDAKKARSEKATIRIHADKKSMLESWSGGGAAPEGWWSPGTNEVHTFDTRTQSGSLDEMLVTLFHEASHQFMSLLSRGGFTPAWLNEGTASFFEGAVAMADGRVLWPDAAIGRLNALCYEIEKKVGPSAADVVSFASPGSYPPEYYAFGWGLVFFLQQYEDPQTLEYVFRPLYADYRSRIIQKGGDPMKVFQDVFLGKASPLGHKTFDDFARDWQTWIFEQVRPLHGATKAARELRLARVKRYLDAADTVKTDKKSKLLVEDLLTRALGHIEYVRSTMGKDNTGEGALLVQQADILERLKRPAAVAPLLEKALDLADSGAFALEPDKYAALEKRLQKIDAKNAALRTARSRTSELARAAQAIVKEYEDAKEPLILRGYTFAALTSAVLGDDAPLAARAADLRAKARDAKLLLGSVRALESDASKWKSVLKDPPTKFTVADGKIDLAGVRSCGFIDTDVLASGEYEMRATIRRTGPREPGSAFGLVVAGTTASDWTIAGIDDRGTTGLWKVVVGANGGASTKRTTTAFPKPELAPDDPVLLVVHVYADGRITIKIGDREPIEQHLDVASSLPRHVGVFAKNGAFVFEEALVEIYP